jgi:hypothetical protein
MKAPNLSKWVEEVVRKSGALPAEWAENNHLH